MTSSNVLWLFFEMVVSVPKTNEKSIVEFYRDCRLFDMKYDLQGLFLQSLLQNDNTRVLSIP